MSYDTLVRNQVDFAFKAAGDLAKDAVFTTKTTKTFDFGAKTANQTALPSVTVKAVLYEGKKNSKTRDTMQARLFFKKSDLADPTKYDTVVYSGVTYRVGKVLEDTGYTITLSVFGG